MLNLFFRDSGVQILSSGVRGLHYPIGIVLVKRKLPGRTFAKILDE